MGREVAPLIHWGP